MDMERDNPFESLARSSNEQEVVDHETKDVKFAPADRQYDQLKCINIFEGVKVKLEAFSPKKEPNFDEYEVQPNKLSPNSPYKLSSGSSAFDLRESSQVTESKLKRIKGKKLKKKNVSKKQRARCKYCYVTISFDELKEKDSQLALKVINYRKTKAYFRGNIHMCGLTFEGKCSYMSYASSALRLHQQIHKEEPNVKIFKVTHIPSYESTSGVTGPLSGRRKPIYVTMKFTELQEKDPELAKDVLELHHRSLKYKTNIHFCSRKFTRQCDQMSHCGAEVNRHVKLHHPEEEVIKVVAYPNEKMCGSVYSYEVMSFIDLEKKDQKLAKKVLKHRNECKSKRNIHICGLNFVKKCNYFSYNGYDVLRHAKFVHKNEVVNVFKIIGYPRSDE